MKIIYEPHPITPARKAKLQQQGYKIIDAIFAPAGTPIHQGMEVEDTEEVAADVEPVVAQEAEEVVEEVEAQADVASEAVEAPKRGRSRKD
jgi:hypothetical protein